MDTSSYAKGLAFLIITLLVTAGSLCARTIYVDDHGVADYYNIKAAVDASRSGDTIILAPGTYRGSDNTNVAILDKALTIQSSDPNDPTITAQTVIDCSSSSSTTMSRAFEILYAESQPIVTLAGLTICNGATTSSGGGSRRM